MAYSTSTYVKALMWYNDMNKANAEREYLVYRELGGVNISALNDIVSEWKRTN